MRWSRRRAALAVMGLIAICSVFALRHDKAHTKHQLVLFYPASKATAAICLTDRASEAVRELAFTIKQRGPTVAKQDVLTLASIGYFKIGEETLEWHSDLLFTWDASIEAYLVLKDARLGQCFALLRSRHVPFDPADVTLSEWQDALNNLAMR